MGLAVLAALDFLGSRLILVGRVFLHLLGRPVHLVVLEGLGGLKSRYA